MLKIWFTLKQMGMSDQSPAKITTTSPNQALKRLFAYGNPDGDFYIPFAHTKRFMTMKPDAGRSIIQTNLRRWAASGSVVTVDPTDYLDIAEQQDDSLEVKPGRAYPQGLGFGKNGFSLEDDTRVAIPFIAFGMWYYRQDPIEDGDKLADSLKEALKRDLHITSAEFALVFVADEPIWTPELQNEPLSDKEIYEIVERNISRDTVPAKKLFKVTLEEHKLEVASMVSPAEGPRWLNFNPLNMMKHLIDNGSKSILLYGPPRTGKTYAIDKYMARNDASRETIQIHDGWSYDELVLGFRPGNDGTWKYAIGPLLKAIRDGKTCIVLEEINRTEFAQAIGEILSLIENKYRGQSNSIRLRNGELLHIPENTLLIFTMNTLDRTTEEIDDAIFGRMDSVEFPPRVEDLEDILQLLNMNESEARKIRELFSYVQRYYPLGHGYFASLTSTTDFKTYYLTRIRPVLQKHFRDYRDEQMAAIDEKVGQLFG
jgi:hypothetical protein